LGQGNKHPCRAQTEAEAISAVKDMLSGNSFGEAGSRVVIEEFLLLF
jgi:phosphoribosylamine--glycine ligase